MTKIINLFAGPGAGKSTTAAHVFALLKQKDVNCELVREWIKEPVWEGRILPDQLYIFAKQQRALNILKDKVDVIVTDSPILLSNIYGNQESQTFQNLVREVFDEYTNINFFLERQKIYNPNGRFQSQTEAEHLDLRIYKYLLDHQVPFKSVNGLETAAKIIVKLCT